eukprot:3584720-Prymnesium_polylepis.1
MLGVAAHVVAELRSKAVCNRSRATAERMVLILRNLCAPSSLFFRFTEVTRRRVVIRHHTRCASRIAQRRAR